MLDRNLILCGLPVGLILGVAAWMSTGRAGATSEALEQAASALQAMPKGGARRQTASIAPPSLTAPLFAQPEGAALPVETSVVLQGLSRTPRRQSALLAIGARPAEWLTVGETREGVTLDSVGPGGVTITTPSGTRDLGFGPANTSNQAPASIDPMPPPGVRSPPPPASAPGAP